MQLLKNPLYATLAFLAANPCITACWAMPVDHAVVPVTGIDQTRLRHEYIFAYDSSDPSIVYYAPKDGRIATSNGMPLFGFARTRSGQGYINAQFAFEITSQERAALMSAIRAAGYTGVPMPYIRTRVKPIIPGWDPDSGNRRCDSVTDATTGATSSVCDDVFESLAFVRSGPTLGENIAIAARLSPLGAEMYDQFLRQGNSFQVALESEYYAASDAFTATVTVNYTRLLESFSTAAHAKGFLLEADVNALWRREGLCAGRPPEECSVRVELVDGRGRRIDNITVGDHHPDANLVWQAVRSLQERLQNEMLQPISPVLGEATPSRDWGFQVAARYQHIVREGHAQFEFQSTRNVNVRTTISTATIACLQITADGSVDFVTTGRCGNYWTGAL